MSLRHIDGMTCSIGETPKSGFTVGMLIDRLSQYDSSLPIGFTTGPGDNLEILSLYQAGETNYIWIDLGEAE